MPRAHPPYRRQARMDRLAPPGSWWLARTGAAGRPVIRNSFHRASSAVRLRPVAAAEPLLGELLGGEAPRGHGDAWLGPYRRCRPRPPAKLGAHDGFGVKLTVTRCSVS